MKKPQMNNISTNKTVSDFCVFATKILQNKWGTFSLSEIHEWVARLNESCPDWRLFPEVIAWTSNPRRDAFISACVTEDIDRMERVVKDRMQLGRRKKTIVDALRRYKKIAKITVQRILWSKADGAQRDCIFIIRRLPVGGIERALVNQINSMALGGHSIDLLVLGSIDSNLRSEINSKIDVCSLKDALGRRYRAAVNYSQWHFPEVLTRGITASRKIQWIHSDLQKIFDYYPRNRWAREYRRIDHFVCVSEYSRQGFERIYPFAKGRVSTVYSLYDIEQVRVRARFPSELQLEHDLPVLVTVARLVEPKGLERAIRAQRILQDRGINFRWYIVGDGPLKEKLRKQAEAAGLSDRFILSGLNSNPFPIVTQADIFILPSYHEGYGLTVLEAMTLAMPIILTDFGPAREILTDGTNGLVVPNNLTGIVEGIERLLQDSALRESFRKELSHFQYDNKAIIESIERLLFA